MRRNIIIRKITLVQYKRPMIQSADEMKSSSSSASSSASSSFEKNNASKSGASKEEKEDHMRTDEINSDLQWLGSSLGLFSMRDKDKSCFRIFVELIKAAKADKPISSNEISFRTGLARGTVVHHLNNMMSAGIVISVEHGYKLRMKNIEQLINSIERDAVYTCSRMRSLAKKIDSSLGIK